MSADLDISASQDEKYEMVIAASKGELRFDEIKSWVIARLMQKSKL